MRRYCRFEEKSWDEVLPIPDVDGQDGLQTPNYNRKTSVPTPPEATSKRSRLVSQKVAHVRKDANMLTCAAEEEVRYVC